MSRFWCEYAFLPGGLVAGVRLTVDDTGRFALVGQGDRQGGRQMRRDAAGADHGGADEARRAGLHLLHSEPAEMVEGDGGEQVGGDEQAVERAGPDLVHEEQAGKHRHRPGDAGERVNFEALEGLDWQKFTFS